MVLGESGWAARARVLEGGVMLWLCESGLSVSAWPVCPKNGNRAPIVWGERG